MDGPTLLLLIGGPLIGGPLLILVMKRKPAWKQPFMWAVCGIVAFELFRVLLGFALGGRV